MLSRPRHLGYPGLVLVVCALCAVAGCAGLGPRPAQLAERTIRPPKSVVIFFVDGMDHGRFEELIARGRLPNIQARFVDGGVGVEHAIVSLPSITYASAVSIITGRFPGHHGVLGNQWFDREKLLLRDYGFASTYLKVNEDFRCPTLYEILDNHFTVNVQGHTRRGVSRTIDNPISAGLDWALGGYSDVDRRVGECIGEVATMADRRGYWPSVYFNYFPGVDEVGHRFGADSSQYEEALVTVDGAIGRIVDWMEEAQPAAERYYVLLTDHGHVPAEGSKVLDVGHWLEERCGLRVHQGAVQATWGWWRRARLERFDAVVVRDGPRRVAIHLRGAAGWHQPALPQRIRSVIERTEGAEAQEGLCDLAGVCLVCTRAGADAVRVYCREGKALVERQGAGQAKQYRLTVPPVKGQEDGGGEASDPLGYGEWPELAAFVAAGWHDSRAWLAATAHTRYPDFVPQVVEMFDSGRAGDVVAFAEGAWSFDGEFRGGHGSCLASDMRVPLYFAGPGLSAGARIGCARLVDVMPTVLDLLGEHRRLRHIDPLDGVSLLPELRSVGQPVP